jgi:hypothetical protein
MGVARQGQALQRQVLQLQEGGPGGPGQPEDQGAEEQPQDQGAEGLAEEQAAPELVLQQAWGGAAGRRASRCRVRTSW